MMVLLIFILGISSGGLAYADCQADMQAIDKAAASAKAHGLEAAASSNSAAASGAAASAGTAINPNAGASSAAAGQCTAGLQQGIDNIAKDLAAAQKPTCQNPNPSDQAEELKCAQCRQKKAQAIATIQDTGDQVAAGAKGCQDSKKGSDETKKESDQGGQMPQMPQSGSGSEPEKTDTPLSDYKLPTGKDTPPASNSNACSKPDSYNNPDCNEKVVEECTKGTGKNCEQFTFRYCSAQSSGGTGEGIGSSYCKKEVAKNFCKEEGRNQCPTCKQQVLQESDACKGKGSLCVSASTEQQLKDAKANCPSDPIFTDPKNAMSTASLGGASGSSGGGGGSGSLSAGASGAVTSEGKSTAVGEEAGRKNLDISPSSGGGFSGYGNGSSASADSSGSPFQFGALGLKGKSGAAGAGAGAAGSLGSGNMLTPEVHGRTSKSIFMMSSEVYMDRCQRDLIHHCGPNPD